MKAYIPPPIAYLAKDHKLSSHVTLLKPAFVVDIGGDI